MTEQQSLDQRIRCEWCGTEPYYVHYHDTEWGVPQHSDQVLFEKLILEGAQAGLSWSTILKRREGYRRAFDQFDVYKVARYDETKIATLLADPGIIRNRLKVEGAVKNARAFIKVQEEFGSFDAYLWRFVDGKPIQNTRQSLRDIPATTPLSDTLSKDLKKRGFTFVGSTMCYAYLQSMGLVNDHVVACFRYPEVAAMG